MSLEIKQGSLCVKRSLTDVWNGKFQYFSLYAKIYKAYYVSELQLITIYGGEHTE